MLINNLGGTNRINNNSRFHSFADGASIHGLYVSNSTTNMTLFELKNTTFENFRSEASTVVFTNAGTANMTLDAKGNLFRDLDSQALSIFTGGTGTVTATVGGPLAADRNEFRDAFAFIIPTTTIAVTAENNLGIVVALGGTINATVENNLFDNIAEEGQIANTSIVRTQNAGGVLMRC